MNTDVKFDTAIRIVDGEYKDSVKATYIRDLRESLSGEYENEYKYHLYCPECRIAQLHHYYGDFQQPHFRNYGQSSHADYCSCKHTTLSVKRTKTLIECSNGEWKRQIKDRLHKILGLLFHNKTYSANPFVISKAEVENLTKGKTKQTVSENKLYSFPRKLISNMTDDDLEIVKIFYDRVYIKWIKGKDNSRYSYILLYKKYSDGEFKGLCCSITITDKVYPFLDESYKCNQYCNIAIFTSFHHDEKKKFKNTTLIRSHYIDIVTINKL